MSPENKKHFDNLIGILLKFVSRVLNPSLESKAISAFIGVGVLLMASVQAVAFKASFNINLVFISGKVDFDNAVSPGLLWLGAITGVFCLAYGAFALYKYRLSPASSRSADLRELAELLQQAPADSSNNALIQEKFSELYKITTSIPIIRFLHGSNDVKGNVRDYRFASAEVDFDHGKFKIKNSSTVDARVRWFRRFYFFLMGVATLALAAPINPLLSRETAKALAAPSFMIMVVFGIIGVQCLGPLRALAAAKRLLNIQQESHPGDRNQLISVFQSIHSTTFDRFVEYGKYPWIYSPILFYWSGFNSVLAASSFHIYSSELRDLLEDLRRHWGKSMSAGEYFTDASSPILYKWNSVSFNGPSHETIKEEIVESIEKANQSYRAILAYQRRHFSEIDLTKTNQFAFAEYQENEKSIHM